MAWSITQMEESLLGFVSQGRALQATENWFGASLTFAVGTTVAYLFFVAVAASVMKSRNKPIVIPTPVSMAYNLLQITLCSYMVVTACMPQF